MGIFFGMLIDGKEVMEVLVFYVSSFIIIDDGV